MKKLLSLIGLIGIPILTLPNIIGYSQNQVKVNGQVSDSLDQINDATFIENQILARENRSFQHSFLTPTGYFLEKGKEYSITINKNVNINDLLYLSIGQFGGYKNLNDGKDNGFETHQIIGDNLNIIPKISGMLYLKDYRFTNNITILSITKNEPIKVPTFIVDETNQIEFFNKVLTTKSFFVEIISKHVFGTFQTEMFKNQVINTSGVNINDTILAWDQIWKYSNEAYGLNEEYSGVAKKYPQFIHITNPDEGPGYASSTNYRITFQNKTNAGRDLFTKKPNNQWGLWHEIGHTYQTPQYKWTNLTEVTVNISALYVQKFIAGTSNVDDANNIRKVKAFLDSNATDKDFNKEQDLFMKLTMFWQLQMAFGDNFYPTLSQVYRTDYLTVPNMQQDFVKITSKVTNRNLIPFFQKWGFNITDDTRKAVEQLPLLKNNIWENVINGTHQPLIEWQLPKYQVSTLKYEIKSKKVIDFGTKINETNLNDFFDISENKNILKNEISFNWMNYYIKDNKYYLPIKITVKDDDLLSNKYLYFVQVSFEDTLSFIGYVYYQRGIVGLDKENKKFVFTGSRIGLDVTQTQKIYYTITIRNQKNQIIKDFSLTGADNVADSIKRYDLLNISYQEGFTIEVNTLLANKTRIFNLQSNTWATNNIKYSKYLISNNHLIKI